MVKKQKEKLPKVLGSFRWNMPSFRNNSHLVRLVKDESGLLRFERVYQNNMGEEYFAQIDFREGYESACIIANWIAELLKEEK